MSGVYLRSSAVVLLALTACAELRWHKDGADEAALERDLAACRQEARLQAERQAVPPTTGGARIVGVDRFGRPVIEQPERLEVNRGSVEYDLARYCMDKKGYRLIPVEQR